MKKFEMNNENLRKQFDNIAWIKESGVSKEELKVLFDELMKLDGKESRIILKAKLFALLCEKSRIAIDKEDIFQDKLFGGNFLNVQRWDFWNQQIVQKFLKNEYEEIATAVKCGAYRAEADFGHTSPNSKQLVELGLCGLLKRVEKKIEQQKQLSKKQVEFYESCKIVLNSCISVCLRLAEAIAPYSSENESALRQIAQGSPTNSYEVMQLLIIYFFLHEYVFKTRVRTLGRLDILLYPYYKRDIESGRYSKAEIKEMLKFFLNKFSSAKVPFGLPFCLGGMDENGEDITNDISYLIVEAYQELNIYSPKIHIRVSNQTPTDFIKLVLRSIRDGKSSFVFCNDNVTIQALMEVGVKREDARDYTPIGCYEPAVWGKEIGCTGNSGVNLAKAVEFTLSGGIDVKSGKKVGLNQTRSLESFEAFYDAVKEQIAYMAKKCMDYVCAIEKYYGEIGPDPLLSCMYEDSVLRGIDVYEGGAKYNNSSVSFYFIATLVDSITAIKKFVYDEKIVTLTELFEILNNNWVGAEKLRLIAKKMPEKYGNENEIADWFTKDISDYCASLVNNVPNARGGVFKASLFSIDRCFDFGEKTMPTPDGRREGEALSKNLCASWSMDKNGVLALINSVTKIDHAKFSNGSVLDVVLHPTAVQGNDGIDAFYGILKTYFAKGGFALHGNVFNFEDLRAAQKNPEKYETLQVRVCGWNAYFVSLTKAEQDSFIKQSENAL